jgi:hypothetical protein
LSIGEDDKVSNNDDGSFTHIVHELMFIQPYASPSSMGLRSSSNGTIPRSWTLLNIQSTVDVFRNGELLADIKWVNTPMNIR